MLVPVAAAIVLWMVTGSALVLAFAALGPIGMVAQRLDARIAGRKRQRLDDQASLGTQQLDIDRAASELARERDRAWQTVVTLDDLLQHRADHVRGRDRPVLLGEDAVGMPVVVSAIDSITVVARGVMAEAFVRSVRAQLRHSGQSTVVSLAADAREAPVADATVTIDSLQQATLRRGFEPPIQFQPHYLGRFDAALLAKASPAETSDALGALAVAIGQEASGEALTVDLAAGPHAIIAGASGSGKTETIRRWLVAMCERFNAQQLNLVLIDFKGGSGFAEFAQLPHTVCLATDLDQRHSMRAIHVVQAELTRREQVLLEHVARSFEQLPSGLVPRLVVCLDEYQLVVERSPELGTAIADICARGRSLGIHVMIVTQHPTRSVRDHILANCGLRILMRVNDPAESAHLIGSRAAAELSGQGSVVVRDLVGTRTGVVTAIDSVSNSLATQAPEVSDSHGLAQHFVGLPTGEMARAQAQAGQALLLVDDLESLQLRSVGIDELRRTAIIGPSNSGRSTTIDRFAELAAQLGFVVFACARRPPDALAALAKAATSAQPVCVLVDDFDDLLAGLHPEYRHEALRLIRLLMSDVRNRVVLGSRSATALDELCDSRILLTDGDGHAIYDSCDAQVVYSPHQTPEPTPVIDWQPRARDLVVTRRIETLSDVLRQYGCTPYAILSVEQWRQFRDQLEVGAELVGVMHPELWPAIAHSMTVEPIQAALHFPDGRLADVRMVTRSEQLPPLIGENEGWSLLNDESPVRVRIAPKPGIRS